MACRATKWKEPWHSSTGRCHGAEQASATGTGDLPHQPLDLQMQSKGLGAGTLQGLPGGKQAEVRPPLALGSHLGTSSTYSRSSGTTVQSDSLGRPLKCHPQHRTNLA